jgi:hypothetical protein
LDGATWGLVGAVVGTVGGCLGAYFGARASYKAAVNEAQRRFYRKMLIWLVAMMLLFIVIVWAVSFQLLPYWIYVVAMIAWFLPLGPTIVWANRRLAKLAAEPDAAI